MDDRCEVCRPSRSTELRIVVQCRRAVLLGKDTNIDCTPRPQKDGQLDTLTAPRTTHLPPPLSPCYTATFTWLYLLIKLTLSALPEELFKSCICCNFDIGGVRQPLYRVKHRHGAKSSCKPRLPCLTWKCCRAEQDELVSACLR